MKLTKFSEFLNRSKIPIDIQDNLQYNRVTIRINHNGVSLRDSEIGRNIGTKKQFILKAGQFIVSKIDARYGAFGIAPEEVEGAIITGNFWAYDVDEKKVNIEWFNQFTNSPDFYDICERASSGITHRKYLDEKFFLNYEILLPSVDVQLIQIEKIKTQKISFGILTVELSHQLTLVKNLRQQLLQDAVQGKLVSQNKTDEPASELLKKIKAEKGNLIAEKKLKKEKELPPIKPEEIPFEIPENWVWCRLGEMVNIKSGKRIHASDYRQSGIPFLRSGEIGSLGRGENLKTELFISESKYQEVKQKFGIPKAGDILIACIGGSIGNTWVVDERDFYYKDGNLVLIETIPLLNKYFLLSYLKSPFFWNNTILNATDSSYNALTIVKLNDAEFPLPPLGEQNRIVQILDELMQYCNELEEIIKESEIQNEKLLQQVLREALRKAG
jgi:type I restriction enzyme S subunit